MGEHRFAVLLDGLFFTQPRTGSGQYTIALWREFAREPELTCYLGLPNPAPQLPECSSRMITLSPPRGLRSQKLMKLWWEQRGLPRLAERSRPDLVHIPYFAAPLRLTQPFLVTIHDVIPLVLPEYRASLAMRFYLALVRRTVQRAARILTDSEWSRQDIQRHLGIPDERIRVIPLGVDPCFRPAEDPAPAQAWARRWNISGPIVLNLGGFDVRKNLPLLVRAFARALPNLPEGTTLVIPGQVHARNSRLYPPLAPLLQELGIAQRVVLPGAVSEEEKLLWYQAATVYAFPSVYEGFGLSPLEAMACGVPVIAARRTSVPEVVGDAGLLVEPDEEAFARALIRLLNDRDLWVTLRERGMQRARQFSWRRTAIETLTVYQEVRQIAQPMEGRIS